MDTELQDWEVLDNSSVDSSTVNSGDNMELSEGIGGDSDGVVSFDYFSLQNPTNNNFLTTTVTEILTHEEGLNDSDKPNSFDPLPDTHMNESRDCKFSELDYKNELGIVENDESPLVHDVIVSDPEGDNNSGEFLNGSSGSEKIGDATEMAKLEKGIESSCDEKIEGEGKLLIEDGISTIEQGSKGGGEAEKRRMVWWKLPLDLLRYYAIRVSPMWTMSVMSAVLGFVILGRQLRKMKKKSHSLQLNLGVDDKKALQLMSKAARLNESFSIVRRVPVIRASHPASGVTVWPVMNLR